MSAAVFVFREQMKRLKLTKTNKIAVFKTQSRS